jgi:hypothetical protein
MPFPILASCETVFVVGGKKGTGKSTPEPDNIGPVDSRFVKTKTGKLDEFDATGNGLGSILDNLLYVDCDTYIKHLEAEHRKGYERHPVSKDEFSVWEKERNWGDK